MIPIKIKSVLETSLYVDDLEKAEAFYSDILGFDLSIKTPGRHAFFRCGKAMLLIFNPDVSSAGTVNDSGSAIPKHGTSGSGHVAFSIPESAMDSWCKWLRQNKINIESEIDWPNGGHSIYFRDPANNSLELTSPRIWNIED